MANRKVMDFYNGRYFEIPKYQRGYAWDKKNVRELFSDVFESIESNSSHYIGTIVLSRMPENDDRFYIVDGQQRITTITMIINQLIRHLTRKDADFYRRYYIKNESHKLKPLGKDKDFLIDLIRSKNRVPENKSQRLMQGAHEEIVNIIATIPDKKEFLKSIERMEVMEFIEDTEGDAIRIFQTVNDRGKPLSNMEKAKSLLVYFSNRYLGKSLDVRINDLFGEIFELYDDIKHIGELMDITLIKNVEFNEDNVMRYHFVSYINDNFDATASYVLEYLKNRLTELRKSGDVTGMSEFITQYTESLHNFFKALKGLLDKAKIDENYFKLFCILGISATLYPLMVKLEILGMLGKPLSRAGADRLTISDLIEIIDVRIYKTRGTDPRAEISRLASEVDITWTPKQVEDRLISYNQRWMGREEFLAALNANIYGNRALPHIFIDYCEEIAGTKYSIENLTKFQSSSPTIEHIASQTPSFSYETLEFSDETEFFEYQDKLGNLTVLEKSLNSAVQNRIPSEKTPYYDRSVFTMTRKVSSEIANAKKFIKSDIDQRTKILVDYCQKRWWC